MTLRFVSRTAALVLAGFLSVTSTPAFAIDADVQPLEVMTAQVNVAMAAYRICPNGRIDEDKIEADLSQLIDDLLADGVRNRKILRSLRSLQKDNGWMDPYLGEFLTRHGVDPQNYADEDFCRAVDAEMSAGGPYATYLY